MASPHWEMSDAQEVIYKALQNGPTDFKSLAEMKLEGLSKQCPNVPMA